METAIQVIWWIGLIGALIATLVILKEVALVLKVLRDILVLAEYTRDAARGIAVNADAGEVLRSLKAPLQKLRESAGAVRSVASGIEGELARLVPGTGRQGG